MMIGESSISRYLNKFKLAVLNGMRHEMGFGLGKVDGCSRYLNAFCPDLFVPTCR
ncbi:hypothetical protein X798_04513 [Onchocerca flexuosa]|uniref:Uncharacterized protein n=1 Tax=Onchocerca flexuosa TaxID=387005 RepID=A0A238BT28_9BILA|nr:hypothetical protein X798_04513 [Onchocerca flexuosa]